MNSKSALLRPLRQYGFIAVLCLSLLPLFAKDAKDTRYLPEGKPDAIALLAPPPLPDSQEQAADLQEVRDVSHAASSSDLAAARAEKQIYHFHFYSRYW